GYSGGFETRLLDQEGIEQHPIPYGAAVRPTGLILSPVGLTVLSGALELLLVADVVDQQVFAQAVRGGEEGAALVDLGDLLDEAGHVRAAVHHESVDGDPLAGTAHDFL